MKKLLHITFGFGYLVLLLFSFVVLKKSGAAVFYMKSEIQVLGLVRDGNAYQYQVKINNKIFDPATLLVLEDKNILEGASPEEVITVGDGRFAFKEISSGTFDILFSPTGNSDPASNGHTYHIYIRPYLISRQTGKISFLILLWGLIAFLWMIVLNSRSFRKFGKSTFRNFRSRFSSSTSPVETIEDSTSKPITQSYRSLWLNSVVNTFLVSVFFILMEWVFFVTKPSFMDILNWGEKVKILIITSLMGGLFSVCALFIIFLITPLVLPVFPVFIKYAPHLVQAFLTACLSLILFDNFTYTVFKFGIVNSRTLGRLLYALVFTGVFGYILQKLSISAGTKARNQYLEKIRTRAAVILFSVCFIFAVLSFQFAEQKIAQIGIFTDAHKRPHIILFGTDGLNADNMSVYGYERDTTPFIRRLAATSLVSANHFTNSGHSMGTDTALLTGKLPFSTRVLYPPDTLKGIDRYQHLPGLLRRNGYYTIQLGTPYYVDAKITDFQNAFDSVNCDEVANDTLSKLNMRLGYDDEIYLLKTIWKRIEERLGHIFFFKDMENPYSAVTQSASNNLSDQQRMECLRAYLEDSVQIGKPLFAQVHLMGTHGGKFYPTVRVYSKDQEQKSDWMTDFYDDAILDYDREVEDLVKFLQELGQYDNTILIIYTDHGQRYKTINRLPLIIHFPYDQYAGTITSNTQTIDIAPTVLDYLGIDLPDWMMGKSILGELDPNRLIFAGSTDEAEFRSGKFVLAQEKLKPPFYQFSRLSVIQCQYWFFFDLKNGSVTEGLVDNYVNPCDPQALYTTEVIRKKVGEELRRLGYQLPEDW